MEANGTVTENRSDGKRSLPAWTELLQEAIRKPGSIHEAFTRFHGYSLGNQLLALGQCYARKIQPGPIGTFPKWKEVGRHVRKGEKAITLCMPLTSKVSKNVTADDGTESEQEFAFTRFVYKPHWFVLSQTDGAEYQPAELPEWNEQAALAALNVTRIEFGMTDGNVQGFARRGRQLAINPVAVLPEKTLFHELAHIVLGHCDEADLSDSELTPRDVREMEAEAVALLCSESLGLPGAEYSRGYIQHWAHGQDFTERSAHRIFRAADQILRAGNGEAR